MSFQVGIAVEVAPAVLPEASSTPIKHSPCKRPAAQQHSLRMQEVPCLSPTTESAAVTLICSGCDETDRHSACSLESRTPFVSASGSILPGVPRQDRWRGMKRSLQVWLDPRRRCLGAPAPTWITGCRRVACLHRAAASAWRRRPRNGPSRTPRPRGARQAREARP